MTLLRPKPARRGNRFSPRGVTRPSFCFGSFYIEALVVDELSLERLARPRALRLRDGTRPCKTHHRICPRDRLAPDADRRNCRAVADTLPGLVEQIEEEQRQAAVPLSDEPPMTYHERRAAKTAPR